MKRISLFLAIVLIAAACGDDSADPIATSSTTAAPTSTTAVSSTLPPASTLPPTTAPPTTVTSTTAAPTTTSAPVTTVAGSPFTTDAYGFFPDPLGTAADGHGSGCVLDGDVLTDGMWFGFVEAIGGGAVTFDLGCFFTGPAAVAAATADGSEAFDFYIRNQNPKTFSVPLDPSGTAYWLDGMGDLTPLAIAMTAWPMSSPPSYQSCPAEYCSVWLYVNGGVATELIEQYLP